MKKTIKKRGISLGDILSYAAMIAIIIYCALIAVQAGLAL